MASGSFTGTTSNTYITPRISWSSTANTSTNKSSLTVRFQLCKSTLSNASTYGTGSWTLTIGSGTYSFSDVITIPANGSYMTVYSKTVTITHDDDGEKSVAIKVTGGIPDTTYTSTTLSKTIKLDIIPRSSSFSIPSSVNTGSSFTVTISPSSSSFRHKVKIHLNSKYTYTSAFIAAGTTSFTYTIPHSWLPNTTSKTVTVYLYTYTSSSDSYIASVSKTMTVNVPSKIKPSVSKLTTTLSSGGLDGKYVQGKSTVKLVATASPGDGAQITSYIFKGVNISGTASSYTGTSNTKTSSMIQSSGKLTYKVAVKDTRGRISDYKSAEEITVYTYAAPQITSISAQRCLSDGTINSDGTYAKVTVKVSYSTVGGSNTRSVTLSSSADNFAKTTTVIATSATSNTYSGVFGSGQFKIDASYQIKATIKDKYTSHESSATIKVAQRTINIAKYGNGVAIGGLSTRTSKSSNGLFECNWDANFSNTVTASRGRFTAATDIEGSTQNNAPLRIGDAQASHLDFDTNEIISKDDPTTVGRLNIMGYPLQFYLGDGNRVMYLNSDETSSYVRSETTYNRTYDSSPNMYITSNGVFGRSTSSSQRYKTDIENVNDDTLNPYNVLNIPVRQYKYNEDNVPIGRDVDDLYIGLVAEEVQSAYPIAAEYNEDGQVEMWNIKVIVPAMLKILQDQQKIINELKQKVEEIEMNTQL